MEYSTNPEWFRGKRRYHAHGDKYFDSEVY